MGVVDVFLTSKHTSTSGGRESVSEELKLNSTVVGGDFVREEGIIGMQNRDPVFRAVEIPSTEFVQDTAVEVLFAPVFD